MTSLGEPQWRGGQLLSGLLRQRWTRWDQFSNLSRSLRARLETEVDLAWPTIVQSQPSLDGSTKHVFALRDGRQVEGVHMPYEDRVTLCLSSQVGCALGCTFCATGQMGIIRNLSAAEIVGQVMAMLNHHAHPQDRPLRPEQEAEGHRAPHGPGGAGPRTGPVRPEQEAEGHRAPLGPGGAGPRTGPVRPEQEAEGHRAPHGPGGAGPRTGPVRPEQEAEGHRAPHGPGGAGPRTGPVNLVFMGMGEPLHNFDHLMAAFGTLTDEEGLAIPPRRITVSTSGLVSGIDRLGTFARRPRLALSLNATTDAARSRIMPVNRVWNLEALAQALGRFPLQSGERITIEYVLLKGVSDSQEDGRRLAAFAGRFPAKVNLIPFNPHEGSGFEAPEESRIGALCRLLSDSAVPVSVRRSRGQDVAGACGQLVREGQPRHPKPR